MPEKPFESQSYTIIETLLQEDKLSREKAEKFWYESKTYKEILKRKLTYISAMRAYYELAKEKNGDPRWMEGVSDM